MFHIEARINGSQTVTNFYKMPGEENRGYMYWHTDRKSEIQVGSGTGYLFHTRLLDSSRNTEDITKIDSAHDQVQMGGTFSINSPLGTFSCIRNDHRYYRNDTFYLVRYFAEGLGLIKQEEYVIRNAQIYPETVRLLDSAMLK